ncbi:hypothetical protein BGX27_008704 [Mortierella sp. AM989]|nr:hypothetical protein BGX27_008704 [Mortierella sp. AM989]
MANNTNGTIHASPEDDSILSFLTTDFLESQTTNPSTFDSSHFFDPLPADSSIKYHDLLHPPSPPTSVGTFSESSGSPQHSNVDSCDEGSGSDVPMETNPLDYWQYVYPDLTQPSSAFPLLPDLAQQQQQGQQQPGAWPNLASMDASLLQSSVISPFPTGTLSNNMNSNTNINSGKRGFGATPNTPPSPVTSVKADKKTKRVKKQAPTPSQPTLAPLAPLKPLMPLAPLVQLAPQPTPLSPPTSVHDVFIKQSPPLSPRIISAPPTSGSSGGTAIRRPSIVPALTPSVSRSNPVVVKSTLLPEEKPQSEAVMSAQAKRQERLIKNRAAALLSRKRKREHINLLETHTDLLKSTNQELTERVSELEESVQTLTVERDTAREERDSALRECERLHRQINVLSHRPQSDAFRMDLDLERNIRSADTERGLNSKATGVIILFSFALFNLPGGKLETLMVGGSIDRPRIGSSIVGRTLDSYTNNPTISGQVREGVAHRKDLHNMTDLVVFSDNRALQTWLGHQPVVIPTKASSGAPSGSSASFDKEIIKETLPTTKDEDTKSVGLVAQNHQPLPWTRSDAPQELNEPDRDAWLYCSNLMYSLRPSNVVKAAGSAQATNGEYRRPRISIIQPLDGVAGSPANENTHLPPWMPNPNPTENDSEQRYLRLDVEVTSSRVVSGKGLGDHEQLIRFPLVPFGVFDNSTTSLVPSKAAAPTPVAESDSSSFESKRPPRHVRSSRINPQGGIVKTRRNHDNKDRLLRGVKGTTAFRNEESMPLASIKEEPMEVYIKEELLD